VRYFEKQQMDQLFNIIATGTSIFTEDVAAVLGLLNGDGCQKDFKKFRE
jgi:hypothetical protein